MTKMFLQKGRAPVGLTLTAKAQNKVNEVKDRSILAKFGEGKSGATPNLIKVGPPESLGLPLDEKPTIEDLVNLTANTKAVETPAAVVELTPTITTELSPVIAVEPPSATAVEQSSVETKPLETKPVEIKPADKSKKKSKANKIS